MYSNRRDILKTASAAGLMWPFLKSGRALATAIETEAYQGFLHPDLRSVGMRLLEMYRSVPPLSQSTLAAERKGSASHEQRPLESVPWRAVTVPGNRFRPDTAAYLINEKSKSRRPAIVHMHGGGFVNGSARGAITALQRLTRSLDCTVLTVDYRLAPETVWSGSIEDNYSALKWLYDHADEIGIDRDRIAIMGESAGGGHAALLAIAARDRGEVPVAFQCLIYPMLDDRTGTTRPVPAHMGRIGWTAQRNHFGWRSFLGAEPGSSKVPVGAVPARTANLANLPRAFIGVGSIDLFCDEDIDYARRLNDAGVAAELVVVPGAFHGFDNPAFDTSIGRWFTDVKLDALRRALT